MNRTRNAVRRALLGATALSLLAAAPAVAQQVTGKVTDASGRFALEGAVVSIPSLDRTATTDGAGAYRFASVPPGEYEVMVSYIGAAPVSRTVTVDADGVMADFQLGSQVTLTDNVLVVGQRGSLYASLNQERAADNIVEVLSADAIGRLPDQNVAESARRISGVSVQNDQGEGRFVVIRGINPNLNTTSINGVRVPAPDGGERAVALDVIDADIVDSLVITKSLTPDLDADGIGGNINIKTASGFDREGLFIKGQVKGIYTHLSRDIGEKLALAVSDQFAGGKAAFAGSVSWNARTFQTDNKEPADWTSEDAADGEVFYPEEMELREYEVTRERLSASLNLDFRPAPDHDLFLRGLFNDFRDQEFRAGAIAKFGDGLFDEGASSAASGLAVLRSGEIDGEEYALEFERELKDREETQRIWSVQAGGQSRFDRWTVDYLAAFTHAEEDEPGSVDAPVFVAELEDPGAIGFDVSDPLFPNLAFADPATTSFFYDPASYEFDELEFVDGYTEDEELTFGLDLAREVDFGRHPGFVKFGGKARLRDKLRDSQITIYDGFAPSDLTLDQFADTVRYPLDAFGPAIDRNFSGFFFDNRDGFEINQVDTLLNTRIENFEATEDIYAAYAMASVDIDRLRLVGGLRWERTEFSSVAGDARIFEEFEGDPVPTVAESGGLPDNASCFDEDGAPLGGVTGATPVDMEFFCLGDRSGEQEYDDFLPSVNARFEASDDVILRAAYYRSVARPVFESIVPVVEAEQNDEGEREAFIGNPDIERQVADNFDAGLDWYIGDRGVFSLGVFYKTIDDFIAFQVFEDFDAFGVTFEEVETAVNLQEADLIGVEFNYQQAFDFLPSPFDGFIAGANLTLSEGEAVLVNGREIPLPGQSETVANLTLGYEKYGFDVRLTAAYRDKYLDTINEGGEGVDRFHDEHLQWDFRAQYDVTENLTVFADVTNLNDEPFVAFLTGEGGRKLLNQYEEYSYTASFGVKFQY